MATEHVTQRLWVFIKLFVIRYRQICIFLYNIIFFKSLWFCCVISRLTKREFCQFCLLFQINEDLDGEVQFLAQTGPFCVPVKCGTKKCDVSQLFFVLSLNQITASIQCFAAFVWCHIYVEYSKRSQVL